MCRVCYSTIITLPVFDVEDLEEPKGKSFVYCWKFGLFCTGFAIFVNTENLDKFDFKQFSTDIICPNFLFLPLFEASTISFIEIV